MDIKEEILKLKKDRKAVILAHNYQLPEIQDTADYLGDSLELAKISRGLDSELIVFCGVKFMAETAKILSPKKTVLLPAEDAGCPLADSITKEELLSLRSRYPQAKVVSYVNTSAVIKAETDVCCTSANAVGVVKNIESRQVIFVPDKNLGAWVKKKVLDKEIIVWQGSCYVHEKFSLEDLEQSRKDHSLAEILVHPECRPEVQDKADFVLSTSGMLRRAKESSSKEFIIGTEYDMIHRLKKDVPSKKFFSLGGLKICRDMKKITLKELYVSLLENKYEVFLDEGVLSKAEKPLLEMVKYA